MTDASPEYVQLLRGEIEPDEYVELVKQQVRDGLAPNATTFHQSRLHAAAALSLFFDSLADAVGRKDH